MPRLSQGNRERQDRARAMSSAARDAARSRFSLSTIVALAGGAQIESLESRQYLSARTDANGWTVVTPSGDSRIIYVSNSGSASNSGLSPTAPLATINKGLT